MAINPNDIPDKETARIIDLYEQAESKILAIANLALINPNDKTVKDLGFKTSAILVSLEKLTKKWIEEAVPQVYKSGLAKADSMLNGVSLNLGFEEIHNLTQQELGRELQRRFNQNITLINNRIADIQSRISLELLRSKQIGNVVLDQTAMHYREQLTRQGITSFVDKAGRQWNMKTYSEMVARTLTAETERKALENRFLESGQDLVKVSKHADACYLCVPWEAEILSMTGKTKGFPTMAQARAAGLFHPNCRHVITPVTNPAEVQASLMNLSKKDAIIVNKIDKKPWSDSKKQRCKNMLYQYKKVGINDQIRGTHFLEQSLQRVGTGKGKIPVEKVLDVLKNGKLFYDPIHKNYSKWDYPAAICFTEDQKYLKTIIYMKEPTKRWKKQ